MARYYCKDGQIVYVMSSSTDDAMIIVRYRGRDYLRSRSIIGKTLFRENPKKCIVGIGSKVTMKDAATGEPLTVLLDETHSEQRYTRMGGAYYGARALTLDTSNAGSQLADGTLIISPASPLGKAILKMCAGQKAVFEQPDGTTACYIIEKIE